MPFSVAGHVGPWSYFGLGLHNPEQLRLMGSSSPFLSDTHRIHGAAIYGNIYHKYTPVMLAYNYTSTMDPMGYGKQIKTVDSVLKDFNGIASRSTI